MWESLVETDQQILKYINGSYLSRFDGFWLIVTQLETWLFLYVVFVYLLFKKLKKPNSFIAILGVFLATITSLGLTNWVKNSVERLRPNNEAGLIDSLQVLQYPESFSFWSGHTAVSVTVSVFVYLILKRYSPSRWWLLFFIWPILFSISRLFVGVHYPLDVLVGALVGVILALMLYKIIVSIFTRLEYSA